MSENILVVKTKRWADAIIYRNYLYNFNCRNKNGSIYLGNLGITLGNLGAMLKFGNFGVML